MPKSLLWVFVSGYCLLLGFVAAAILSGDPIAITVTTFSLSWCVAQGVALYLITKESSDE